VQRAESRRVGLFLAISTAIVAVGLLFALTAPDPPSTTQAPAGEAVGAALRFAAPSPRLLAARSARLRSRLRAVARRFLSAFLRYEVGDLDPQVRATLRDAATPGFAARLLAAPPRPPAPGSFPPPARLRRIEVAFVALAPPRAILSGEALRSDAPAQFSFLFELRGGRWLASGAGQ
jgi:hypothetical protein